jgi:hypothetical protein
MKSFIQKIKEQNISREKGEAAAIQLEISDPRTSNRDTNLDSVACQFTDYTGKKPIAT